MAHFRWVVVICVLWGCESVVPPEAKFQPCTTAIDVADGQEAFTIGAIIPMTTSEGKDDARGQFRSRAMILAIDEINKTAGVDNKGFRLRICNTKGKWVDSSSDTHKFAAHLADKEGVQAILTGGSSDTLKVKTATGPRDVLLMSVSATTIALTDLKDNGLVWRVAPSDLLQGVVLADIIDKSISKTKSDYKVAVVVVDDSYGSSLSKVLRDKLPDGSGAGGAKASTKVLTLLADSSNLENELKRADDYKPDAVAIIASATVSAKVVNSLSTYSNLAASKLFFSDSSHNADFLASVTDMTVLDDARGTLPGSPFGPSFETFIDRYQSKFQADPSQQSFTAQSYDAVYCLALAHAWATRSGAEGKVDGPALAEGLRQLSDAKADVHPLEPTEFAAMVSKLQSRKSINIEGASGKLDFDNATGEAPSAVEVWKVKDGKFAPVKWVDITDKPGGGHVLTDIEVK